MMCHGVLCRLRHAGRLVPEDLDAAGTFRVGDLHQFLALFALKGERLGADHLADAVTGAHAHTQFPVGTVGHACHRREKYAGRELHRADFRWCHAAPLSRLPLSLVLTATEMITMMPTSTQIHEMAPAA